MPSARDSDMRIDTRHLTAHYGSIQALDDVSLTVGSGEIFCLLGPNGAGKSTLLNVLLGFLRPTSGVALVNGIDVVADPRRARQAMAYIPETVMLYPSLSGLENLRFFCELAGHRHETHELERLLVDAGLSTTQIPRPLATYSKGMRQKVGIAIALAKGADVLLLDEPTSGLDPAASNEFSRLIATVAARGCAVLMTTHDLFRARASGGRIGIMRQGVLATVLDSRDLDASGLEARYLAEMTPTR